MKKRLLLFFSLLLLITPSISLTADTQNIIDTDKDGLPDVWEAKYAKGDLTLLNKNADYDNDGISNEEEYKAGSDPTMVENRIPKITYKYDALGRLIRIERIPGQ